MTKAEKTRQFIIEQTAPIFNMKGYAGTSMNDLTAATGLTKGSIYGNFLNKDEVAIAAFDYNLSNVVSRIGAEINRRTSTQDKLMVYAEMYHQFLSGNFAKGGCPILNTAIDADDTHPVLREKVLAAVLAWKNGITRIAEQGIVKKEIREDENPAQIALTIIAMIEGAIMIARLTEKTDYWNLIMDSLKKYINSIS
ncbi:TetR/AcrR family transcriptional regulator [Pedobacter punctiformis]|uniref:TetR/AcrR family transcriptional regulator n=1 Tax=Pedobacter punctiformis TaxID=3004097 RepID=A0ABT4L7D2_9SPHI|nr:TetR/AcrR family transcriptional regulator [Pedobacter sp. HCMS5-2]MCZ4243832.1 TetR/AcrR family transcriptional regulator [Pedobacter sp. HCMS5-2]